jgi:hypothetical protein
MALATNLFSSLFFLHEAINLIKTNGQEETKTNGQTMIYKTLHRN